MKKILLLLLINFISINAQENLNPRKLDFSDDAIFHNYPPTFKPNGFDKDFGKSNFILGWNWGQYITKNLDEAMFINTYHHQSFDPSNTFTNTSLMKSNTHSILGLEEIYGGRNFTRNFVGLGLYLEPALYIPQNKRGEFITKANDSTKAIW